jgi:DNA (cytosine-5)-methyltransferase 1
LREALHAGKEKRDAVYGVRRLTVEECEFLMGYPKYYTLVPHRGKPAANGPRYKAIGNSMAVPVMRWIGARLLAVDTAQRNE